MIYSLYNLCVSQLSEGVKILISVIAVIVSLLLIVFLFFGIRKDRSTYIQNKLRGNSIDKQSFDDIIIRRFKTANINTYFSVFNITIVNAKDLKEIFGETQYNTALYTLNSKISSIMGSQVKISDYAYDTIMVLAEMNLGKNEIEKYSGFIISECTKPIKLAGNLSIECDLDIGVVNYDVYNRTYKEMWENLELALISARRAGVNGFAIHSPELNNVLSDEYKNYEEIKEAIQHNEFTIYYQPIVNFENKKIFALESLLRWNHKNLGVLSPNKFLSILEQSGDINWVGTWAFEQAMIQIQNWKNKYGFCDFIININLSSKQLSNPKLFDDFRQISRKYKVEPDKICFEIMEFELFEKMQVVKENIEKLSKAGYLIAIDNYGMELNTLSIMQQIKVDFIKLEKGFMKNAEDNSLNLGIINMLIAYAKTNNIIIIAEGIENQSVLDFCEKFDIHFGQGYYFYKPMPPKELEENLIKV